MFKRKETQHSLDDTQPVDYKRLAKEVVKEQKRQKANEQGCGCLLAIAIIAIGYVVLNSADISIFSSASPNAVPRSTAMKAQRVLPTRTSLARASTALPTGAPSTAPSYLFHVCADRIVNMRQGAGFSNYATAGEMRPSTSYPVVAQFVGESVQGNTTWYQITYSGTTAYVTAYYTYACDATEPAQIPMRDPAEQATITYITTCKDRNLLAKARDVSNEEVRRAKAMCMSKYIMIDLKAEFLGFLLTPLQEAQNDMFRLLCALRINGYGITFDLYADFIDGYGNDKEDRALLARFESDVVRQINCFGSFSNVRWEHLAETWWMHRAFTE